jgi:hypothetical protein
MAWVAHALVATCCAKKSPGGISASERGLPPADAVLPSAAPPPPSAAEAAADRFVLLSWFHSNRKMRAVKQKKTGTS